jgi:CDP-diglyceride synthetase
MTTRASPTKTIAGCLGLAAFAVSIIAGLAVDNPASDTLLRAVVAMVLVQPLGLVLGLVAEGAVKRRLEELKIVPAGGANAPSAGAKS